MHASRRGAIQNYGGLLPPQFAGAAPDDSSVAASSASAPFAMAHAIQRVDGAADFIAAAHRQLDLDDAAPPAGACVAPFASDAIDADAGDFYNRREQPSRFRHSAPLLPHRADDAAVRPFGVPPRAADPPHPPLRVPAHPRMNPLRQQMFPPDEEEFDSGSGDDMGESFCGNNNGISPDAEDDEEADEAASTSGGSFDGETSAAENFFVKENNDVKVLFAMGIGLLHDDGSPFSNWEHKAFDKGKRKRSAVKPGKDHLTAERRRRLIEGGMRNPKFNSQAARHVQLKWLTDNPITTDVDVAFIKATIKSVINKASAVQRKQGKSNAQDLR